MTVAIVSTSINAAPPAYEQWAKQGDLIIAGDRNSPAELGFYVEAIGGRYLAPWHQERWSFSGVIGWNCIQRRNVAVMQAYADGYDYVFTVDDDNFPNTADIIEQHVHQLEQTVAQVLTSWSGWINIGDFVHPGTNQRGHPIGASQPDMYETADVSRREVVVSHAQVLGEPDCDAVTRLVLRPTVTSVVTEHVWVDPYCWAPFNSQSTLWKREWAPFIACLPGIGRYDDIFASLIAERVMQARGVTWHAGTPTVEQVRNEHDAVQDLEAEYWGMQYTNDLVHVLRNVIATLPHELPDAYEYIAERLHMLPSRTGRFMHEWAEEWRRLS